MKPVKKTNKIVFAFVKNTSYCLSHKLTCLYFIKVSWGWLDPEICKLRSSQLTESRDTLLTPQ